MSLINDVLKDLEARRANAPDASSGRHASRAPAAVRAKRRWPLWLLAAVAAGAILHLSLDVRDTSRSVEGAQPLVAQAGPPGGEPMVQSVRQETRNAGPEVADSVAVSDSNAVQATVASEGAESAPARQPVETGPATEQAREAAGEAPSPEKEAGSPEAADAAPEPRQATAPDPAPQGALVAAPAGQSDAPVREAPTISIRRSGEDDPESEPLTTAKRLLARGQVQRAESRLRQLVAQRPDLSEAHELLASTLIRRGRYEAAMSVLEDGLAQAGETSSLAALLGRLLIERGELARARSVLEAHAPPLSGAPDYHLLLAAAYRQAGDHEQAAAHYRSLSETLPRNGAVWIGLGASLESLERPKEAAGAYERALESGDERAARFARGRLAALEKITGESQ